MRSFTESGIMIWNPNIYIYISPTHRFTVANEYNEFVGDSQKPINVRENAGDLVTLIIKSNPGVGGSSSHLRVEKIHRNPSSILRLFPNSETRSELYHKRIQIPPKNTCGIQGIQGAKTIHTSATKRSQESGQD